MNNDTLNTQRKNNDTCVSFSSLYVKENIDNHDIKFYK